MFSNAELLSMRTTAELGHVHKCTLTELSLTTEGSVGNFTESPTNTILTDTPCLYSEVLLTDRKELGTEVANTSTIQLANSVVNQLNGRFEVSNITDQLGTVLEAGPLRVERRIDDTIGFGTSIVSTYQLRFGRPVR